jgi:cytochrome c biogenesis protein CcmG/thiol:disulfide interchange protein DsbE
VRSRGLVTVVIAATALVALLVYGLVAVGESTTIDDAVKRGERPVAPDRRLPRLGGGDGSIGDLKGKPVVLNFWASWCDPCKDEAPALVKAHKQLSAAGGTVLGVTVDDASPDSLKFMADHGLKFPSLRDVEGELGEDYGRTGVPETFVIDRDGRVVAISRGMIDDDFFAEHLPKALESR